MLTQLNKTMSDIEILQIAEERGIEYDPFCLINFVREKENSGLSIDDIIDEYENIIGY